jgi:hypothetical protein
MEALIAVGAVGTAIFGLAAILYSVQNSSSGSTAREPGRQACLPAERTAAEIQRRRQRHAELNRLAGQVQLALLTLDQTPDFQRAASWARHAKDVPAAFRHRIFQRFRPQVVEHLARRLTGGQEEGRLISSLTDLIQALGVASFEAQYIVAEARSRVSAATLTDESFGGRLRELRRDHEQRMRALRGLTGVDPDMKDQLIETEQMRFRQAVLRMGGGQPADSANIDTLLN